MVRLTIALHAASGSYAQDLLESLRFLIASTRLEPGCQNCTAWADADHTVHYIEKWATEADARRHVGSQPFTWLLGLMECGNEAPDVQFDFVTKTRGLDFVAEVRGEPASDPAWGDPACDREKDIRS